MALPINHNHICQRAADNLLDRYLSAEDEAELEQNERDYEDEENQRTEYQQMCLLDQ